MKALLLTVLVIAATVAPTYAGEGVWTSDGISYFELPDGWQHVEQSGMTIFGNPELPPHFVAISKPVILGDLDSTQFTSAMLVVYLGMIKDDFGTGQVVGGSENPVNGRPALSLQIAMEKDGKPSAIGGISCVDYDGFYILMTAIAPLEVVEQVMADVELLFASFDLDMEEAEANEDAIDEFSQGLEKDLADILQKLNAGK